MSIGKGAAILRGRRQGLARRPNVTVSLSPGLLCAVEEWGERHGAINRSEAFRALLLKALSSDTEENVTHHRPA